MPIVTMLNQKGGVGKTSTCHHLAGTLALQGRRVLLIDNDPQASLTQGFWGPMATRQIAPSDSIAAIYAGDEPFPEQVIRPTGIDGIDLVPGSKRATGYNVPDPHLADGGVQTCLREFLADIRGRYDLVLADCPPNLHLCSWAALVASDFLIVPVQPEDYGSQGIIDVQESVALVAAGVNPNVVTLGFLLTMFNARLAVHRGYEEMLRGMYGELVFETTIPIATDFKEALMQRKPVAMYKPRGTAAKTMKSLAAEMDRRMSGAGQDRVRGAA